jgi:hypothetical protein
MKDKPNVSGVVLSVDFGHYLAETLPNNVKLFGETIVVTSADDEETIRIAKENGAKVVTSESFWKDGAPFNRGAGINEGIKAAKYDFIYSFDADVILPQDIREAMFHLDNEVLYGIPRLTLKPGTKDEWELRGTAEDYAGGYSQLFSRTASSYPGGFSEDFPTAGHSDIEFMFHWPKELRKKLATTPCRHVGERKVAWAGMRKRPNRSSDIEETTPTFRMQVYPKNQSLLVQRLDRNKQICHVLVEVGDDLLPVGDFRPEDYHTIPWPQEMPEATLHILGSDGYWVKQQPIIKR